jgi:hypothetical protein
MRATLGKGAKEIAQVLGWSVVTVHIFHIRRKNREELRVKSQEIFEYPELKSKGAEE